MANRTTMALHLSLGVVLFAALSTGSAALAASAPVDSNSAVFTNGGGCFPPPIIQTSPFDLLRAINPEWAPVLNGSSPLSQAVLMHGTAVDSHVSQIDFPSNHVTFDQNTDLALDQADAGFLATGNLYPPNLVGGKPVLELEWETGSYPAWAWAGVGDRMVVLGRWIFDCGHPSPIPGHGAVSGQPCLTAFDLPVGDQCLGAIFNYRSEMHPPQAVAVIRSGGGAVLQDGGRAVPAARADVYVSGDGGAGGDACVVTHKTSVNALLGAPCFPLALPLALLPPNAPPLNATDLTFDVPLPAVPGGRDPVLRVIPRPTPSLGTPPVPAQLQVTPHLDGPNPHFAVTVQMTQTVDGKLPTGFAATLFAGWLQAPASPMVHLRVTLDGLIVNNPLKPAVPGVPTPPGWKMEANVNGLWQQAGGSGLGQIDASTLAGLFVPSTVVYDQFIPLGGTLHLEANAASRGCVDTVFGQRLLDDLIRFGFNPANPATLPGALQLGVTCVGAAERDAGAIDAVFGAPRYGVSDSRYAVASSNGAYTLVFRIERVDD
jgi:hypothetical protein